MNKEIPKTDRVTFITEKNNWLDAGGVKELKMNKSKDVVQIHFENGNIAEIHSCNPYGEGRGALVVSDLVSLANVKVDSPAESGLSPTTCSASVDNTWPVGIDLTRPDFGASLIDANALIYLWQTYDPEYYNKQYKLIERGLQNKEVEIQDEIICRRPTQLS